MYWITARDRPGLVSMKLCQGYRVIGGECSGYGYVIELLDVIPEYLGMHYVFGRVLFRR